MRCDYKIKGDAVYCKCGQVWDAGQFDRPACLELLAGKLAACPVDVSFLTDATPHEVATVWSEKVNTFGLYPSVKRVSGGNSRVTVRMDEKLEMMPRDRWGKFVTAFYVLALVGTAVWLITGN